MVEDHAVHYWNFGTVLVQPRQHAITNMPVQRPSVLMICGCGAQRHVWVVEPVEAEGVEPKVGPEGHWESPGGQA